MLTVFSILWARSNDLRSRRGIRYRIGGRTRVLEWEDRDPPCPEPGSYLANHGLDDADCIGGMSEAQFMNFDNGLSVLQLVADIRLLFKEPLACAPQGGDESDLVIESARFWEGFICLSNIQWFRGKKIINIRTGANWSNVLNISRTEARGSTESRENWKDMTMELAGRW
jgi:hypothetical protein